MLKRIIAVLILIALVSSLALADGMQGYSAKLNKKIATRTGPSRSYDEPGTFFISNWASQTVTVYTKAYRDGVWWVLVDFAERGHPYRLYTGASRVEIDLSMIPEEKYMLLRTDMYGSISSTANPINSVVPGSGATWSP